MERTESKVVQVAPDWENPKIEEMQQFGWSLQNRQEMEQKGEAYGRPSYMAEFTGTYVIKTTVTRFVKLHFARSLNMPNLDKIRQLEAQYEALQFPGKASYTGPGCFTAFFAVSLIAGIQSLSGGKEADAFMQFLLGGIFVGTGLLWLSRRRKKNQEAEEIFRSSAAKADSILQQARGLIS